MPEVVIGLGTNLGDRLAHLRAAVRALRANAPDLVQAVSPIYESDALVPSDAPDDWRHPYLNLAVRGAWARGPVELVRLLKEVERTVGRVDRARWAPREVDLDLLTFADLEVASDSLNVPHPGLAERPFALLPLVDLAPGWVFPPRSGPAAGQRAEDWSRRWSGTPDHVPFRTRRTPLSLTEIVGVLNLTPDSFSDGGRHLDPGKAVEHAVAMTEAGASVIDLGAESTRPGSTPVEPAEEWRRLAPVLRRLASMSIGAALSVDTRHGDTALRALASGAHWINDVTGGNDPRLLATVAASGATLVAMHSLTVPPTPDRVLPTDHDPVDWLLAWGRERLHALSAAGIPPGRVVLDPGIGFGKTPDQNHAILRRAGSLGQLGVRILVGHSRKSFLRTWFAPDHPAAHQGAARDFESALLAGHLARLGIDYVRVHDADLARRAIRALALVG